MDDVAATPTTARHELVRQLQFPPGFRFVPTEEELVDVYLRAKIEGHKLRLHVVNDVSILDWQPGRLVEEYKGYGENRWFFFAVREQSSSNKEKEPSRKVRVPGVTATWKATGSVQRIRRARSSKDSDGNGADDDDDKEVVGTKRVLIYNSTDVNENGKWSMHEYILKGHAAIGQYALYSIQRKQHSDTDDMDPEKKKKKSKKRKTTKTTLLAKPPLKPRRKAKAQRKKKASMQVGIEGEQQQQGQAPMEPVTPPKKDELAPQQDGRQQPAAAAADGAPSPIVFSAVPLQAVRVLPPSEPDGTLGASTPTLEENYMSQLLALYNHSAMLCNNQGQEQCPSSLTYSMAFLGAPDTNVVVDHAPSLPYRNEEDSYSLFAVQNHLGENRSVYMEQGWQHSGMMFLMDNTNTTQLMNSSGGWEHGDDQLRQVHQQQEQEENNGAGAFGVAEDQKPMNRNHPQGGHDLLPPVDEQSSGSDDQQVDSLLFGFGESVQMDEGLDAFVRGLLVPHDEPPQDLAAAGTQEQEGGDDPATLQAAGTQEQGADDTATLQSLQHGDLLQQQLAWLQLQRALTEHVRDGPCSCMICAAGLWHYFPCP